MSAVLRDRTIYTSPYIRDFRIRLRTAVRSAWDTPEGEEMREALSKIAYEYGQALRLEAKGISERYKLVAERFGIREKYKSIWGKR